MAYPQKLLAPGETIHYEMHPHWRGLIVPAITLVLTVFIGSWLALVSVGGLAVILGRWLQNRVPLSRVRIASGVAMLLLALWTAYELVRELSLG